MTKTGLSGTPLHSLLLAWLLLACLAIATAPARAQAERPFSPFEFALLGDPQIGYGPGGEHADARRLGKVIQDINARNLPVSVLVGDLVQDRSLWQDWIFLLQARDLTGTALYAAGNHDVVDTDSLRAFRDRYGTDYHDHVHNNVAFIVLNSETARDPRIDPVEFHQQWEFIAAALEKHRRAQRTHIVLVTHRPPYVRNPAEPESDANWPPETRQRLLRLAREYGVRWIISGHLHRTLLIDAGEPPGIAVHAGTARSFDQTPIGYFRFRVEPDAITPERIDLEPAPNPPPSIPGLRGWTPRLLDFSPRHWLFTLLYAAAGVAALFAARRLKQSNAIDGPGPWRLIGLALLFFGLNMQLDFDELLSETGRILARLAGVYGQRHLLIGALMLVLAAIGAAFLWRLPRRHRFSAPGKLALICLAVPTTWFVLSALSNHHIGIVFNETWWDLAVLLALACIAGCVRWELRARPIELSSRWPPP